MRESVLVWSVMGPRFEEARIGVTMCDLPRHGRFGAVAPSDAVEAFQHGRDDAFLASVCKPPFINYPAMLCYVMAQLLIKVPCTVVWSSVLTHQFPTQTVAAL